MGAVSIKEQVLSPEILGLLERFSLSKPPMKTNITHWHPDVVGLSTPLIIMPITDTSLIEQIKTASIDAWPELSDLVENPWEMSYTIGSRFSYIPWHTDNTHLRAITIYLSPIWDREWSGYLIYDLDDGEGFRAVLPKYNLGVMITAPVWHTTCVSNLQAAPRLSLQVFINAGQSE